MPEKASFALSPFTIGFLRGSGVMGAAEWVRYRTQLLRHGSTGSRLVPEAETEPINFLLSVKRSSDNSGTWEIRLLRGEATVIQGQPVVMRELPPVVLDALSQSQQTYQGLTTSLLVRLRTTYHDWILQSRHTQTGNGPTTPPSGGRNSGATTTSGRAK